MRVHICEPLDPDDDDADQLQLLPETARDERILRRLVDEYQIGGFGREPGTDKVSHVELDLRERGYAG